MPDKPLLFIDVDGVLNPDRDRPGFEPHRVADWDERVYDVRFSPAHGRVLTRLADDFDLVWATTWWQVANERIAPLVGLPALPSVKLPRRHSLPVEGGAFWKTPHLRRYANGRAAAWLDDELDEGRDTAALTGTFEWPSIYADTPPVAAACLIRVGSKWGLERSHVERLRAWLDAF